MEQPFDGRRWKLRLSGPGINSSYSSPWMMLALTPVVNGKGVSKGRPEVASSCMEIGEDSLAEEKENKAAHEKFLAKLKKDPKAFKKYKEELEELESGREEEKASEGDAG